MQLEPRPCLRDELFLLAHKPNGAERVHRPSLSLALAAATLADLRLSGHLKVLPGGERVRVLSLLPTHDPVASTALEYLSDPDRREHRDLRVALNHIGDEIYDRTCAWMQVSARVAKRVKTRLIGANTERYHQTHAAAGHVDWLRSMLYYRTQVAGAASQFAVVDPQSAALCALVGILRLERQLIPINVSDAELRRALADPITRMPADDDGETLRCLVAVAEERIGSQAVSVLG